MLGRDEVDVVATALLKIEHHAGEFGGRRGRALQLPTDVKVLAEDAAQVAAGKEDRAGALPAAQAVFFAEVRDFLGGIAYKPEFLLQGGKITAEVASNHLKTLSEILQNIPDEGFTPAQLKDILWPYATDQGRGEVLWPLRVALSGREKSPDPFTLCSILGKAETLERIAQALQKL